MATIKTGWLKGKIDDAYSKMFAISHAKICYVGDPEEGITVDDKISEIDGKLTVSDEGMISFGIDEEGNYGYKKVGADTVTPFKTGSGVTLIGTYTADTSDIDVSAFKAESADEFVLVPTGGTASASSSFWYDINSAGNGGTSGSASSTGTPSAGSITFSDNKLSIVLPKVSISTSKNYAYKVSWGDAYQNAWGTSSSATATYYCKLYYIGKVE